MPTATYGPLAGKFGRIRVNTSYNMNLSEHELRAAADDIDTTHFESDVSGDGVNVFGEGLVGVVDATIMVRGQFDSKANPLQAPYYMWVGNYGTIFLGLTKTYGFSAGFRVLETPISTAVRRSGSFEGRLKSNGLITPPSGNLA